MTHLRLSATMRISIGLGFIATTALFAAFAIGLIPDIEQIKVKARLAQCETIAISASTQARQDETYRMEQTLRAIVERSENIESIAIRRESGFLVAEIGDHRAHWDNAIAEQGSNTFVLCPILASNLEPWGTIEVRFRELPQSGLAWVANHPYLNMFLAVPAALIVLTYVYLRKMLRHMDPSKAVPSRVRSALNTLTSGLLVLDTKGRIVLANRAFATATGYNPADLQGKLVSSLPWRGADLNAPVTNFDWQNSITEGKAQPATMLSIDQDSPKTFLVNCAPIEGEQGGFRGILASFEDVTLLKEKELKLKSILDELTKSREEICRHNEQLCELAARDPLTGCLNRRSFFECFEQEWNRAARYEHPLCCIMLDLDHFKSINDRYGHTSGDRVLKEVGGLLDETVRDGDLVCRYGGEEFIILLPHIDYDDGMLAGERFRRLISEAVSIDGQSVTASLGVSAMALGGEHPQAIVEQADSALYLAKRNGRDGVVGYRDVPENAEIDQKLTAQARSSTSQDDVAIPFHAVTALISALGYRDAGTADHSRRVADLCVEVGSQLMAVGECYILEIAALLHDIGKIGVPDAILLKPEPLTKEEWEIMGIHDRMGVEIVDSAFNSPELTEIIQTHHAFYGGQGRQSDMPTGKDIPLGSRILSIADTYDAIVSDRVYRKGRSQEVAFAELRRCAGTQFDPDLIEQFINCVSSQTQTADEVDLEVNKKTALRIGVQIERITQAIDNQDNESLSALLGRLKMTAQAGDAHTIAESVASIESAVSEDAEMTVILKLSNDLLYHCRTTQRAFLDNEEVGADTSTTDDQTV